MGFEKHYNFGKEHTVVMKTVEGKNIRVKLNKTEDVGPNGGTGEFAQWKADLVANGKAVQFKSKKTGKYLRLKGGGDVDANGSGGPLCKFKFHKVSDGVYKLESRKFDGKYIAVRGGKVVQGKGGPFCKLEFFKLKH